MNDASAVSLVLAGRGDPLNVHLFRELAARYPVAGELNPELGRWQRLAVGAATFRPDRSRWAERFFKSGLGYALRSRNATAQHARIGAPGCAVFQVHALFEVPAARSILYVDCTHQQSARHWPAWNPLHGQALRSWYDRERRAYLAAAHVFAFSAPTRDSLIGFYGVPAERVTVVGGGLNFDQVPATVGRERRAPTVLFVGNDFIRKGGPTLLAAFAIARRQVPDARLLLVGAEQGIGSRPGVEVLGRVHDRTRLAELYAQATVFCLPSVFEPFGLALLEAMAHGLPCISTTTGGVPEIVGHGETGLLVAPGDVPALAAAIVSLLTDPGRAERFGAVGRLRVQQRFTWARVVDRMAPALDRLTNTAQRV